MINEQKTGNYTKYDLPKNKMYTNNVILHIISYIFNNRLVVYNSIAIIFLLRIFW